MGKGWGDEHPPIYQISSLSFAEIAITVQAVCVVHDIACDYSDITERERIQILQRQRERERERERERQTERQRDREIEIQLKNNAI